MRDINGDSKRLCVLDIHLGAGHFGSSGRFARLEEAAGEMAFILHFEEHGE